MIFVAIIMLFICFFLSMLLYLDLKLRKYFDKCLFIILFTFFSGIGLIILEDIHKEATVCIETNVN